LVASLALKPREYGAAGGVEPADLAAHHQALIFLSGRNHGRAG